MAQSMSAKGHSHRFRDAHAEPGCSAPITDIVGSVLTRFIVLSALASIRVRASALRRYEGHHHAPLSDGDRSSFKKSRAMTRIFAERSKERRVSEALLREADNLAAVCHLSRLNPSRLRPTRVSLLVLFKNATTCSGHRLD